VKISQQKPATVSKCTFIDLLISNSVVAVKKRISEVNECYPQH